MIPCIVKGHIDSRGVGRAKAGGVKQAIAIDSAEIHAHTAQERNAVLRAESLFVSTALSLDSVQQAHQIRVQLLDPRVLEQHDSRRSRIGILDKTQLQEIPQLV
jgi:hypothetical protein